MQKIDSIVIIGGGTAGYLSALTLAKKLPHLSITLIESSKIPVIGVGEATTPKLMRLLHEVLEYDINEFHMEVLPTWKLGIRYHWGKSSTSVIHSPFGKMHPQLAHALTGDLNNSSLIAQLMVNDKSLVFHKTDHSGFNMLSPLRSFAYHIDNKNLVSFLRQKIENTNIRHLDREIVEVKHNDTGVESLLTNREENLKFDLYIDCSGFYKALSKDRKEKAFISFEKTLFTDQAIVGKMPNNGNIKPYTVATTMKNGWLWNTPLQEEDHLGYVFSSSHCNADEARREMQDKVPGIECSDHVIKFTSGRQKNFWYKNLISIGNSYAFIEPLESTGIHMICAEIIEVTKLLLNKSFDHKSIGELNDTIGRRWDMIKWFIGIHFKFNKKLDSDFWKDCNDQIDLSGIEDFIDFYKNNGSVTKEKDEHLYNKMNEDSIFSATSYNFWMIAQGVPTNWKHPIGENALNHPFLKRIEANKLLHPQAVSMKEALQLIKQDPTLLSLDGWFKPTFQD